MIIRVMGEGQYEVDDAALQGINAADDELDAAVREADQARFEKAHDVLLTVIRDSGTQLADDVIATSEVIVPPVGATLEDVAALLNDDGLIPG